MSAGGYCALNLTLRNSEVFSAAVDMSGYTEPTYDGGLQRLFGPRWAAAAAANTPAQYLATHRVTLPLRVRFDVGRGDRRPLREVRALLPVLRAVGVGVSLTTRSGGHTYHVWVPALRDGLAWLATVLGGDMRSLPPPR
jgi:S-formylglutathione hydrolase FrmB